MTLIKMAKEEQFLILVLIITLLGIAYSINLSQESLTKKLDETFLVICKDESGQSVMWKGPKGALNGKTRPQVQHASYGTAIYFNKTKKEDTGNYTCILTGSPNVRKVFSLTVQDDSFEDYVRNDDRVFYGNYDDTEDYVNYSPNASNYEDNVEEPLKFRDTPKTRTAVEGEKSITLVCRVNWRDVDIRWSLASKEALDKKILILPRGLYIPNVTRDDANVYQCEAHHVTSGTRITQDITLDVHHKPSLPYEAFAEEDEVYVFLDEPVNLTCEVEANPPPTFEWRRRNMGKVLNISTHISVLQLNVTDETPGTFQCTASNKEGKLDKYFDVQLGEHPEMPTNIKLLEANTDSLKLKIEVPDIPYEVRDPVMDPQWIVVEYKPKSENEWIRAEFNITNEEVVLTNLSKNTKYDIQAATRNIAGLSQYYSNQTIFETSPAISVHTKFPIVIYSTFILTFLIWIA